MPGPALGALVADHDDVARADLVARAPRRARPARRRTRAPGRDDAAGSCPATLTTAPSGARLPFRMTRPPVGFIGRSQRPHDLLARRLCRRRAPPRRWCGPVTVIWSRVEQPGVEQPLRDQPDAAGAVQVGGDEAAARLEVGQQRHLAADRDRSRRCRAARPTSRAMASRCSTALVEPPVATTAAIAFSIACAREDVARRAGCCRSRSITSAPACRPTSAFSRVGRRHRAAAHRRDAEELDRRGHRVGRELAAARARARTGVVLEVLQLARRSSCRPRARRSPSKTSWMVTSWPWKRPGAIEPP